MLNSLAGSASRDLQYCTRVAHFRSCAGFNCEERTVESKFSRPVERDFSHSQRLVQADCSRRIVHLNFQVYVLRPPMPEFTKNSPQQGRRDSLTTRERMHDEVFDESAGPALRDPDDLLPLILCEKTKIGSELVISPKAGPPLCE